MSGHEAEITRLNKIINALMDRAERDMADPHSNFGLFQSSIMLEGQVRNRTRALEAALHENEKMNRALQTAMEKLEREKEEQRQLLDKLEQAHVQLLQSEKLASIGQLAAGVAHEINNPIGFISSNLTSLKKYIGDLLLLIDTYEAGETLLKADPPLAARLAQTKQDIDLSFVRDDVVSLIEESIEGTQRVRSIVQALRDFSRVDKLEWEVVDLHKGIDSTLKIVGNEIKHKAEVVLDYGKLPMVECLASQLNQVIMNLLVNAAQAIPEFGKITILTRQQGERVVISIEDNGNGMSTETMARIFDPFFTTKPVGKGTGLGLSVSYGIIERHQGSIDVRSEPGKGTIFSISLPVHQNRQA